MRALAAMIMRGPVSAAGLASLFGLAGLILPPLWLVSGATIGLYSLRRGARPGIQVVLLATGLCGILFYIGTGSLAITALLCGSMWLPVWLVSQILRWRADQGLMMAAIGALAAAYVVIVRVVFPDVTEWWRRQLEAVRDAVQAQDGQSVLGQIDVARIAEQMPAATAIYIVLSLTMMLLLSRWWQAMLFNVGGFQKEFCALLLPRQVFYVVMALALIMLVLAVQGTRVPMAQDLLLVAVLLYGVQGLAVAHYHVSAKSLSSAWLIVAYAAFFVIPQVAAMVGIIDTFIDSRGLRHRKLH